MKKIFFILSSLVFVIGCAKETVLLPDKEQLQKDILIIDQWLADNAIIALADPSGLRYEITTKGVGAKPTADNSVVVKYTGKFIKERVILARSVTFDQTTAAVTLKLSSLIEGCQIGLQLLPKGSKVTLYVPSGLAYGKRGVGSSIPPNTNLFYEFELIDVK